MKRVLFLTNIPSPYRVDFFQELGKYCELTVLYETAQAKDRNPKWRNNKEEKNYIEHYLHAWIKRTDSALCLDVVKYLKQKYDAIIVGVYASPTGMYAIQYMKRHHIPYQISCDGGMVKEETGLKYAVKAYFLGKAAGYFSSGKNCTEYLKYYGAEKDRILEYPFTSLWDNDIEEKVPSKEEKQDLRKELGIPDKRIFLSVGQFIYRKGYDLLIQSLGELIQSEDSLEDMEVYVIGGEPPEEYLELLQKWQIQKIHFVPFRTKQELKKYYKAADVFILPTREDIWGLVINEAMAEALPVITTKKCVAGQELVQEKKNGVLVEAEDVAALQQAMNYYREMSEEDLIRQSVQSLKIIRSYTIEKMAEKYLGAII